MGKRDRPRRRNVKPSANGLLLAGGLFVLGALTTAFADRVVGWTTDRLSGSGDASPISVDVSRRSPYEVAEGTIVRTAREQLPPPPYVDFGDGEKHRCPTRKWAQPLGAVDSDTHFRVYLEGVSERTVRLDGVSVEVLRRRPPARGSYLSCIPALLASTRQLRVDLDHRPARAELMVPEKIVRKTGYGSVITAGRARRRPFLFTLRRGEIETFNVSATSASCWCSWKLRFHYVAAGRSGTISVDDDDRPFETSSSRRASSAFWDDGARRWVARLPHPNAIR